MRWEFLPGSTLIAVYSRAQQQLDFDPLLATLALGGASAFGFIGLVLGPIILVTASSLIKAFTRPDRPIVLNDRSVTAVDAGS